MTGVFRAERFVTELPASRAAALGITGALVIVFAANFHVRKGDNGGTGPAIITGLGCLVVAALLFALVIPRLRRGRSATLTLAVLSLLSLTIFWSGITPVLATAALAAPGDGRMSARTAAAARAIAAMAAVVALVAAVATSRLV